MKNLQTQLVTVADALSQLSREVTKMAKLLDRLQAGEGGDAVEARVAAVFSGDVAPAKPLRVIDMVYDVIRRSRKGISLAKIMEKTGLDSRQVSNACYKLSKRNKIEAASRGVYIKKKEG